MDWNQRIITLRARARGFHVITDEVLASLPELKRLEVGMLHLFIQHTSASLTINENVSPDVRRDLDRSLRDLAPDHARRYEHSLEGDDDMPAHIKASLMGNSLSIPVGNGKLLMGTWQGIYLGEHRNDAGPRTIVATLSGRIRP